MLIKSLIGFTLAAASSAAVLERRAGCNADNCLRALRATQIAGRLEAASSACNSFWVSTITPSLFTVTETVVSSTTFISESYTTETDTASETITSTVFEVTAVSGPPTSTRTVFTQVAFPAKVKRCTTATEAFPSWASACSGAVRFTSACSCIGVTTAVTVTAPTPTTTVTSMSIASSSVTNTLTETDTTTLTSTETVTSVTSTQTIGSVATAYANQFKLQVLWTQTGVLRYVKILYVNGVNWLVPVDGFENGSIFSLDNSGALFSLLPDGSGAYGSAYAVIPSASSNSITLRAGSSVPSGSTKLICSIAAIDAAATCSIGTAEGFSPARWSANSSNLALNRSTQTTYNTVKAVPI
ncbi:hypothetical protein TWF788_000721 [Orbilia oligospora]|uniref:Uncharacterized protein n=1 Tax=Orbilia oligospora TaxID=2813651 RepID=A0A7C8PGN3_ORBOL|nr:hypothetical protein TWF788_000721 [Orbilia oligospora]